MGQVDEAFLRRMSRQYEFAMPDGKTRKLILNILLATEKVHDDVDLNVIASKTAYYSGSDMKELCKYAATLPLREYVRKSALSSQNVREQNVNEMVILDGIGKGKVTTNGLFSFAANGQERGGEKESNGSVNVMNVFENQTDDFVLRPIEQSDLLTALKHIKSTMKAHSDHKKKYGMQNKNSLFANMGLFGGMNAAAATAAASMSKQNEQNQKDEQNDIDAAAKDNGDDDILALE